MSFGERIKFFAKQSYGSQSGFAVVSGMSVQQMNDYVSGRKMPSMDALQRMHNAGLSLEWLFAADSEVESISMYASNEAGRALKKKKQALGQEHEPELLGHLSDMPGYRQHIVNLSDSEVEILESLLTKIKGQTDGNLTGA
jgi:transcriptional regulator with XRE-family HTH domain